MIDWNTIDKAIIGVIAIAILEVIAIYNHIDGIAFATSIGAITSIITFAITKRIIINKYKRR